MQHVSRVRRLFVVAALLASPVLATRAHAATIDLQSASSHGLCDGQASCVLTDAGLSLTLTAVSTGSNPILAYKTVGGALGLGVTASSNDRTPGEIDTNESIAGTLDNPWIVDSFKLLFIYNGPEYGDPHEIAKVTITSGSDAIVYLFTVDAENGGSWEGSGIVTNCGPTDAVGSGCFEFSGRPFGNKAITGFSFTSVTNPSEKNDSDYSLGGFTFSRDPLGDPVPVPEPGSMILLGSGLVGAVAARRRRRK